MLTREKTFQKIEESLLLPNISDRTHQIFSLLQTPRLIDIDQLVEIIAADQELTGLILSQLNAAFDGRRFVTELKDAVVLLGLESVQNLLIFFVAQKFFKSGGGKSVVFDMRKYWRHVLATSIAADMLSARIGAQNHFQLFSYGLNHDIGLLVMNTCLSKELDEITVKIMGGVPQIVAEKSVLGGVTHDQIGAWLCRRWNFTPELTRVVQYHHTPYLCTENLRMLEIIFLADLIGTHYYERLLNVNKVMPTSARALKSLGLTFNDQQDIGEQLPPKVDALAKQFRL